MSYSGDTFIKRLAYTDDTHSLEFLTNIIKKDLDGEEEVWFGLDSRSDPSPPENLENLKWTSSEGNDIPETDIDWSDGYPLSEPAKNCAYLDYSADG